MGEGQPERAGGHADEQRLGQCGGGEAAAARPQGGADRGLVPASLAARQQEVGDVGAGDQKDEPDRPEQDPEGLAHLADHVVAHAMDARGETRPGGGWGPLGRPERHARDRRSGG
ncbi:MAG TPA: hypothetical protein VHQ90_22815 [Thermoanaerobaculia bacterium]|nr:hypothetical protein [Thermoanaerobaculia bacterium]